MHIFLFWAIFLLWTIISLPLIIIRKTFCVYTIYNLLYSLYIWTSIIIGQSSGDNIKFLE